MSDGYAEAIFRLAISGLSDPAGSVKEELLVVTSSPALPPIGRGDIQATRLRPEEIMDTTQTARRWSLALVYDQLEHLGKSESLALLGRLRDCFSDHILVHSENFPLTAQEMLSVGFYIDQDWSGAGRLFRYRREDFFEGRSWNTPEQWAHPQNFKRYRW